MIKRQLQLLYTMAARKQSGAQVLKAAVKGDRFQAAAIVEGIGSDFLKR